MPTATSFHQFAATSAARINPTEGVIYGVSLITEGPALGHGVYIDSTTLEQVRVAATNYAGGLKVKMDHGGGAGDIVGYIDNLRVIGVKLIGDFHLLESSSHRQYILEIATRIPDTFGLSIAFSGTSETGADKRVMQRCTEIYSVDLVSEPAANPGGLFARAASSDKIRSIEPITKMSEPTNTPPVDPNAEMLSQIAARLAKLEAFAFPPAKEEPAAVACAAKADDAVMLALKEFAAKFGTPPAPVSIVAPVAPVAPVAKTFEQIVAEKRVALKGDNAKAITSAIAEHPAEYAAYRAQFGQGQTIKL